MTTVGEALDLYRRRRMARERTLAAVQAAQGIAGLIAPSTLQDIKRASRAAEWELNACTSNPEIRRLLKQAQDSGITLSED